MIDHVRPGDLETWMRAQSGPAVVLDVREPRELALASLQPQGFELIAIPMNQLPARLAELDPGRPVACLCHHGTRSQHVAMFLASNGFGQVANISGGIEAWALERDAAVPRY